VVLPRLSCSSPQQVSGTADLGRHRTSDVKIGRGEAQDMVARIQERVLPSQISCHAIFVVLPIELDDQLDV
jgi:hypothetical protein